MKKAILIIAVLVAAAMITCMIYYVKNVLIVYDKDSVTNYTHQEDDIDSDEGVK